MLYLTNNQIPCKAIKTRITSHRAAETNLTLTARAVTIYNTNCTSIIIRQRLTSGHTACLQS